MERLPVVNYASPYRGLFSKAANSLHGLDAAFLLRVDLPQRVRAPVLGLVHTYSYL